MNMNLPLHYNYKNLLRWGLSLGVLLGLSLDAQSPASGTYVNPSSFVTDSPEARSPFVLLAINDPETGLASFSFGGQNNPPVIRAAPGEDIHLTVHE